jgi:hypothetical protein
MTNQNEAAGDVAGRPSDADVESEMEAVRTGLGLNPARGGRTALQCIGIELRRARGREVELVAALEAIRPFVAEDFPVANGRIDWSVYHVSFGYARAYRQLLQALGSEPKS